jgi:hypothetical protein
LTDFTKLIDAEYGQKPQQPEAPESDSSTDGLDFTAMVDAEYGGISPEATGWDKVKQGAGKIAEGFTLDALLDRMTPDMVKDYQVGGFEGVIRGNAERSWVPGADIAARTMLGEDFDKVVEEETSGAAIIKGIGEALPTPKIMGQDVPIFGEAVGALQEKGVEDAARNAGSFMGLDKDPSEWNALTKASVEAYEKRTGHKWLGPRALEHLQKSAPGEYRKVRNRQGNAAVAFSRGAFEAWTGILQLGVGQIDAIANNRGMDFAGTAAGTVAGTMMEDWAQTIEDPGARATEDPFGFTMDMAAAGTGVGIKSVKGAGAAAQAIRQGVSGTAAAEAGLEAARAAGAPVLGEAASVAADLHRQSYDLVRTGAVDIAAGHAARKPGSGSRRFIKELLEASPSASRLERRMVDAMPEAVEGFNDLSVASRQKRTGRIEQVKDVTDRLDDAPMLERLFGEAADDAGVLHVLESAVRVQDRLTELRALQSMDKLDPAGARLLDELSGLHNIEDVARYVMNKENGANLDRGLAKTVRDAQYADELLNAAIRGSDDDLRRAIEKSKETEATINARHDAIVESARAVQKAKIDEINAKSVERVAESEARLKRERADAYATVAERVTKANEKARDLREGVAAQLRREAVDAAEVMVRQREKATKLDDQLMKKTDEAQAIRDEMADLDATISMRRTQRPTKPERQRMNRLERKLRKLDSELATLEDKFKVAQADEAKMRRKLDRWDEYEQMEMARANQRAEDLVADAHARSQDDANAATRRHKKRKSEEQKRVHRAIEVEIERANAKIAKSASRRTEALKTMVSSIEVDGFTTKQRNAIANKARRTLQAHQEYLAGLEQVNRLLKDPESVKANGAWLEFGGNVVGTFNAAAHVLSELNAGKTPGEIFSDLTIRGDDARAIRTLEEAREALLISSELDMRLVEHGVITQARAAAQMGRNLLTLTNPRHAKEYTISAIAEAPVLPLAEKSNVVAQLDLIRDVKAAGDAAALTGKKQLTYNNLDYDIRGTKTEASGVERYKRQNIRGEQAEVGTLRTPEGDVDMVRVPETRSQTRDMRFNKYGDLAGEWVTRDTFDGLQKFIGSSGDFWTKWGSAMKRIRVVDNLSSLFNMNFGNLASMAWDNIPPQRLTEAMQHMRGKGSDVDKAFLQHFRYEGVYEGASGHHLAGLADSEKLADFNMKLAAEETAGGHLDKIGDALYKGLDKVGKYQGFGGLVRESWGFTDKAFRVATARTLFERGAKKRGYDTSTLDGMQRALADEALVGESLRGTLRDTLDYGSVAVGPRIAGRGIYEWAADTGLSPFIIYPLKAGGLWAKRFADNPGRLRFGELAGEAQWQDLSEWERTKRLAADFDSEIGARGFIGGASINLTPLNPVAFLPAEIIRGAEEMGEGKMPSILLLKPVIEAGRGRTEFGTELWHPNDSGIYKGLATAFHIVQSVAISPSMQRALPQLGERNQGAIERLWQDPVRNRQTGQADPLAAVIARMFVSFDIQADEKAGRWVLNQGVRHESNLKRAARELERTGDWEAYKRDVRRAEVQLAKDINEVVSLLANR